MTKETAKIQASGTTGKDLRSAAIGVALLTAFSFIEPLYYRCSTLPDHIYFGSVVAASALRTTYGLVAMALGVCALWGTWRLGWREEFEEHGIAYTFRWIVCSSCVCLAWAFSTHSYNFVYGEYHLVDRLLLITLSIAVCFRPAFLPLFAIGISIAIGQFDDPLSYSWTDKMPVVQTIYLGAFFQIVRAFDRRIDTSAISFATLTLWSAFYFATGLAKLRLNWLMANPAGNIVCGAAVQNGWLSMLEWQQITNIATMATRFGFPLKIVVVATELGAAMLLFNRRMTVAIFSSAILMHVGIFAISGICFWKWALIDLVWIFTLVRFAPESMFGLRAGLMGLLGAFVFISCSSRDVWLGWLDSPVAYRFEICGFDHENNQYTILPENLAPYDLPFAQGRLYFLTDTPQVVDCLGAVTTDASLANTERYCNGTISLDKLRELEGTNREDNWAESKLEIFLKQYIEAHNDGKTSPRKWFSPPHHIWASLPLNSEHPRLSRGVQLSRVTILLHEYKIAADAPIKVWSKQVFETGLGTQRLLNETTYSIQRRF